MLLEQILAQKEAYGDLWYSCKIGDAYIDSIHQIDTYTRSTQRALMVQFVTIAYNLKPFNTP